MATRAVVDVHESLPGPSRSYSTVPVHKWTCTALKTLLKARGLSYSGMKKDERVAKLERYLVTVAAQQTEKLGPPFQLVLLQQS